MPKKLDSAIAKGSFAVALTGRDKATAKGFRVMALCLDAAIAVPVCSVAPVSLDFFGGNVAAYQQWQESHK